MKRPVTFYSEGCKLVGDVYYPDDLQPGETRAGIVLCHGYTGVKDLYLPDNARVLNEAGYMVMTFDYKGWGESAGVAPRPILFITTDNDRLVPPEESEHLYTRAGAPKKLVVLKGYGHYEVYVEPAFSEVMAATLDWDRTYLPAR